MTCVPNAAVPRPEVIMRAYGRGTNATHNQPLRYVQKRLCVVSDALISRRNFFLTLSENKVFHRARFLRDVRDSRVRVIRFAVKRRSCYAATK